MAVFVYYVFMEGEGVYRISLYPGEGDGVYIPVPGPYLHLRTITCIPWYYDL